MIIRNNPAGILKLKEDLTGFEFVEGPEHTTQKLTFRMRFWKGEWRYDLRIGMPFKQDILGKKVPDSVIQGIFRDAITQTPGVERCVEVILNREAQDRKVSVSWEALLLDGSFISDQAFIVGGENE